MLLTSRMKVKQGFHIRNFVMTIASYLIDLTSDVKASTRCVLPMKWADSKTSKTEGSSSIGDCLAFMVKSGVFQIKGLLRNPAAVSDSSDTDHEILPRETDPILNH
jgi:hypothetical protein